MEDLLKDLREVCEKHGIEVVVDSASLELGYDGELVFRCVDLNRRKMCENRVLEMIEELQTRYPGLILAGNIKGGIGMADRIRQATGIANELSK